MSKIVFKDFNLGGIADSIYMGIANSLANIVGFDIHSIPGLFQVNQKMTKDSGSTVTEFCLYGLEASTGIRYWFSSTSGKIWQEKNGVYALVYTTSPTAGTAYCAGCYEYNGYIYWATQNQLHRIAVASADGSSAWTTNAVPNWKTFLVGNSTHHPMTEVNLVLYIGDGYVVAQVDDSTFSNNALDLPPKYVVTAMGRMSTQLLVGASIPNVNMAELFQWNTYSTSFDGSDTIWERGINAFLMADNYILVSAGVSGSIYLYNGSQLEHYKRVPGTYTSTKTAIIYPGASAMFKGSLPIFGVSNASGNPCNQGIWSFGKHSRNYNDVMNLEYPISQVDADGYHLISGVEIGQIIVSGMDIYCSWKTSGATGIDKLDYSNKIAKPYFETKVVAPDRTSLIPFSKFIVHYKELPSGTSIVIKTKIDNATDWSNTTEVTDTDRKYVYADADRLEAKNLQVRVECVSSSNNSPSIEEVDITLS